MGRSLSRYVSVHPSPYITHLADDSSPLRGCLCCRRGLRRRPRLSERALRTNYRRRRRANDDCHSHHSYPAATARDHWWLWTRPLHWSVLPVVLLRRRLLTVVQGFRARRIRIAAMGFSSVGMGDAVFDLCLWPFSLCVGSGRLSSLCPSTYRIASLDLHSQRTHIPSDQQFYT